ncbi:MAG: HEAT repeat domain-containing protein [Gemmatimonadales bacterium]
MDAKSTFIQRFGDLVALLRVDPGNDAAQDLALTAAAAAVETVPVVVEAGVEWSVTPDDLTLKGRLLARQVELIRIAAGTEPHELLALARALSHDTVPVQPSPSIEVEMVEVMAPPPSTPPGPARGSHRPDPGTPARRVTERRTWTDRRRPGTARHYGMERRQSTDRRQSGERRLTLVEEQQVEIGRLHELLMRSVQGLGWDGVLTAALALVRLVPRVPMAGRRTFGIQLRRAIPRRAVEAVIDLAEREPEQRERATEVLRWIGLDAAEVVLERLLQGEALGVRGFYYEVLGGMPGVYPLVTPLLASRHAHEIRHGAALLARLGQPAGVAELVPLVRHPEESVRTAAVRALGEIHDGACAEPLRQALHHTDPRTRVAAAEAIGSWRGGALALLLAGALESERNRDVWQALIHSLGRLGTVEACSALATVALSRRNMLRRQGFSTTQRLAAVQALALNAAPPARITLERLAQVGEGVVRYAADRILCAEQQRAG